MTGPRGRGRAHLLPVPHAPAGTKSFTYTVTAAIAVGTATAGLFTVHIAKTPAKRGHLVWAVLPGPLVVLVLLLWP
jgi:hypothetical protein